MFYFILWISCFSPMSIKHLIKVFNLKKTKFVSVHRKSFPIISLMTQTFLLLDFRVHIVGKFIRVYISISQDHSHYNKTSPFLKRFTVKNKKRKGSFVLSFCFQRFYLFFSVHGCSFCMYFQFH